MQSTILVIEDDPMASRLVELMLAHEGYQVVIAPNGLQGLEMAQTDPPDLVLLDLMLPGLDGLDVLSQLQAEPLTADIPVIVVSSKSQLIAEHRNTGLIEPRMEKEGTVQWGCSCSKEGEKATAAVFPHFGLH